MDGFRLVPGDIAGYGNLGYHNNIADTDKCGSFCLNTTGCWSYEYSKTTKACHLNSGQNPDLPQSGDFAFCEKTGYIPLIDFLHV